MNDPVNTDRLGIAVKKPVTKTRAKVRVCITTRICKLIPGRRFYRHDTPDLSKPDAVKLVKAGEAEFL